MQLSSNHSKHYSISNTTNNYVTNLFLGLCNFHFLFLRIQKYDHPLPPGYRFTCSQFENNFEMLRAMPHDIRKTFPLFLIVWWLQTVLWVSIWKPNFCIVISVSSLLLRHLITSQIVKFRLKTYTIRLIWFEEYTLPHKSEYLKSFVFEQILESQKPKEMCICMMEGWFIHKKLNENICCESHMP